MDRCSILGLLFVLLTSCCFVTSTITINKIIGPSSIEDGTTDELILDCDYETKGEGELVVKWFFNGLEEQIYQWISGTGHAYASGPLKEFIDTNYRVSRNPDTMFRALRFKEVSPILSGNYTCKVSSDDSDSWLTKQIIVYSPAEIFALALIGGDEEYKGDEVVICDVTMISPKPTLELYIAGMNDTLELPKFLQPNKTESFNEEGFYNISITMPFNSSFLDIGSTKFVCQLGIPGTNYSQTKSVEHVVDTDNEPQTELFSTEDFSSNATSNSNSTEEQLTDHQDSGSFNLQSSMVPIVFLIFAILLVT